MENNYRNAIKYGIAGLLLIITVCAPKASKTLLAIIQDAPFAVSKPIFKDFIECLAKEIR